MADERRIDTALPKQLLLERQNHGGLRDGFRQLRDAPHSPRPHLRRDVVEHGHADLGARRRDHHVEVGIVDEDHRGDVAAPQPRLEIAQQREVLRDVLEHLDKAHHGEIGGVLDQLDARRLHQVAADSREAIRRAVRRELARDTRRMQVAGRLSGDEQNLTHGSSPSGGGPAREAFARCR